jgi:hypothetical protein
MLIIKKRKTRSPDEAVHAAYVSERIRNRTAPLATAVRDSVARHTCIASDCTNNRIDQLSASAVVRFALGHILYKKAGAIFKPKYQFHDGTLLKFAHSICAYDAGVDLEEPTTDHCRLCGQQFFCAVDPVECCIRFELGEMEAQAASKFVLNSRGAVHWACARVKWSKELMKDLR